jgi:hypothetical protein
MLSGNKKIESGLSINGPIIGNGRLMPMYAPNIIANTGIKSFLIGFPGNEKLKRQVVLLKIN